MGNSGCLSQSPHGRLVNSKMRPIKAIKSPMTASLDFVYNNSSGWAGQ